MSNSRVQILAVVLFAGCGGESTKSQATTAGQPPAVTNAAASCRLNSDCADRESCVDMVCTLACREDRDCPAQMQCGSDAHGAAACVAADAADAHPGAGGDCYDEVACLLADKPPACCSKYNHSHGHKQTTTPDHPDRATIKAAMTALRDRIDDCQAAHGGTGSVKAKVTVAPSGVVTNVDVVSAPNQNLGACVAGVVRTAVFGTSVNGITFTYPWVFR